MAKILAVDDEKSTLELVSFILERDGHAVTAVGDGQACLDHVTLEKPDLILLDIMMPVMDGYTVFNRLAESEETRGIPVIIMSAKGEMRDAFQMATNFVDYVHKPFDPAVLRERVKKALELRPR